MFCSSIQVHSLLVCLATEWVQQFHSASTASLITSTVPNVLLTHVRPSPNRSLSAALPRDWEKLHRTGVELKAHHRQRRLLPRSQAASLSLTLLLCWWLLVSVVSPGTTALGRVAVVGRIKKFKHCQQQYILVRTYHGCVCKDFTLCCMYCA